MSEGCDRSNVVGQSQAVDYGRYWLWTRDDISGFVTCECVGVEAPMWPVCRGVWLIEIGIRNQF